MKIDPLTKVTLSVATRTTEPGTEMESTHHPVTFIFGIGPSGLTDFECALTARADEDEIHIRLKPIDSRNFFEHLAPLFAPFIKTEGETLLHVALLSAEPAGSTEVVKAMASNQQCGCGCGCHES